jgi:glutamine---fructose-6-phosphate transaminase (isomerizing)
MTHFLQDIIRQPEEIREAIDHLIGGGRPQLLAAADIIRKADKVYLTGIGASWNAALAAGSLFHSGGRPVYLLDGSELLFAEIPSGSVVIMLSRSGRSVEIVKLLAKVRAAKATVIGITNFEDGALAREADVPVLVPVRADWGISVNTYTLLALAAAAVAVATVDSFDDILAMKLSRGAATLAAQIPVWRQQLGQSLWLNSGACYYFLGRGASLASACETRLLWEEGAKSSATAMGTGTFRHGPQEITASDTRFAIWIDSERMREQDLTVARDLSALGASVMLIGHGLPTDAGNLIVEIPPMPPQWQFLIDIVPAQLAAEALARRTGVDCDTFRFASYVVEDEHGIVLNG